MTLDGCYDEVGDRSTELFKVIAPTLEKLTIEFRYPSLIARDLSLLTHLSRLSIFRLDGYFAPLTPLLYRLPPSLSCLRLDHDKDLLRLFLWWKASPSTVPATLAHIQCSSLHSNMTIPQLPPLNTFNTRFSTTTIDTLNGLSPGTAPFKTLEMEFSSSTASNIQSVQDLCRRLGVGFRSVLLEY